MTSQSQTLWQRILTPLTSLMCIVGISIMLALILALGTAPLLEQTPLALACGLANTPTMLANNDPAIPTPVTPTSDPNQPVGFFPGDYYSNQGITFTEDLSAVPNAPPKDSLQWRWNFGDGSATASGTTPAHTYTHAGTFAVNVQTYDSISASWVDFDSATITLIGHPWDNPPIAKAAADKMLVAVDESVTFDASGSKALVGSVVSYLWNFGDASAEAQGPHVTHTFTIPGKAQVTLIVTDSRGALSTAVVPVQVVLSIPQVRLAASATTAQIGQEITFHTSLVQIAQGDQIVHYIWDFGDQTPQQTTTSSQATHRYTKAGQYHAQVQAVDAQNVPGTATINVTIQPAGAAIGGSNSIHAYVVIGLAILAVLALGVLLFSSLWHSQPAPATQGPGARRNATSKLATEHQKRAPSRVVDAARRRQVPPTQAPRSQQPGERNARPPSPPSRTGDPFDERFLQG